MPYAFVDLDEPSLLQSRAEFPFPKNSGIILLVDSYSIQKPPSNVSIHNKRFPCILLKRRQRLSHITLGAFRGQKKSANARHEEAFCASEAVTCLLLVNI